MTSKVPSVFNTFRKQENFYTPIPHMKTPKRIQATPQSVNFPAGHASFPAVGLETLAFSQTIQAFSESLAEVLALAEEEPSVEEPLSSAPPTKDSSLSPKQVEILAKAFTTLQLELQEVVQNFPKTNQPIPKEVVQVLVQLPRFIDQLKGALQKPAVERPIIEETEVPIELEIERPATEEEKQLFIQLQKSIPTLQRTLQTALEKLPPALPQQIKETLEQSLQLTFPRKGIREPVLQHEVRLQEPKEQPKSQIVQHAPIQEKEQKETEPLQTKVQKRPLETAPQVIKPKYAELEQVQKKPLQTEREVVIQKQDEQAPPVTFRIPPAIVPEKSLPSNQPTTHVEEDTEQPILFVEKPVIHTKSSVSTTNVQEREEYALPPLPDKMKKTTQQPFIPKKEEKKGEMQQEEQVLEKPSLPAKEKEQVSFAQQRVSQEEFEKTPPLQKNIEQKQPVYHEEKPKEPSFIEKEQILKEKSSYTEQPPVASSIQYELSSAPVLPAQKKPMAQQEMLQKTFPVLLQFVPQIIENLSITPEGDKELFALLERLLLSLQKGEKFLLPSKEVMTLEEAEEIERILQEFFPVVRQIRKKFPLLPKNVPHLVTKILQELPEKEEILLKEELSPEVRAPHLSREIIEKEPQGTEAPEKTRIPEQEVPIVETEQNIEEITIPEEKTFYEIAETERVVIENIYPYYVGESRAKEEIESPKTLPPPIVLTAVEFKERNEPVPPPPEISTDIPFAFIVPYIAQNPIHSVESDLELPQIDFWKEIERDEGGAAGGRRSSQILCYVPRGEFMEGDPLKVGEKKKYVLNSYAIGMYLVTNRHYSEFLTEQSRLRKIYIGDKGLVFSKEKDLLCQVSTGTYLSDIEIVPQKEHLLFLPKEGKEAYPMVCVTYMGAKAFCEAGGFRLPTEKEWEKAASIVVDEKNHLQKKYRFGCSQDEISQAFANYGNASNETEILTTPVGFYNGKTNFMKEGVLIQTFDAVSPFGCYDMSGNVWEWTETGDGKVQVVKGGCFCSDINELQVDIRKQKKVEALDGHTGFRVALS